MSALDREYEYLSPDFDPMSITVPRLRSILVAHNVNYPASAKKPELIALFNEHVVPQAKKFLAARSRTKRSTRGIVDMPSRESSVAEDDTESDVASLAPPESVRRSTRRSTRGMTEESDAPSLAPSTARRTTRRTTSVSVDPDPDMTPVARERVSRSPTKRTSSKHARASEIEEVEARPPPSRRSRQSTAPKVKHEERDTASPFTQDNPFQSGSSPMSEPRTAEHEMRRKTLGPEHTEKRKSSSSRRRTERVSSGRQDDGVIVPSSRTFEPPVYRRKREPTPVVEQYEEEPEEESEDEGEEVDTGEEFTAEEQLELVRDRAKTGQVDILPPRRNKLRRQTPGAVKAAPWAVLVALLGGFAMWWRQEKLQIGYCGLGEPSTNLAGIKLPEYAQALEVLRPECEPCPQHAYCYKDLRTVCETDFILRPHPLSFGGLIPLAPTCEPDGEKARKVKAVADRAVEELRERNAKFECGDLVDETGIHLPSPEINEQELKEEMSNKRRRGMSQSEFEELWASAIPDIAGRDEIVSNIDGQSGNRSLASTSLARISLACAARRSLRVALARHLWRLVSLLAVFGAFLYARYAVSSARQMEERAKLLASYAYNRLATQAALHAQDPRAYPESFISMSQLRDDILRDEFSAKRRQRLWERVQRKVEQNTNVRPSVRESRSGDVSRVWEWIGAVGAIEDAGAFKRSVGGGDGRNRLGRAAYTDSPSSQLIKEERKQMPRNWDEGRPIY